MLSRSRRLLLDGADAPGGRAPGVVLSGYRSCPDPCHLPQAPVTLTEAAEDGAIYMVATRPATPAAVGSPGGGQPARSLKAGTLPRLAQHLLEAQTLGDTAYVPAFLATHRAFTRPIDVLQLLLDRLEEVRALEPGPPTPDVTEVRRAFASVLYSWLEGYPEDFRGVLEPGLWERLSRSLQVAAGKGSETEQQLQELLGAPAHTQPEGEGEDEEEAEEDANPLDFLGFQAEQVAAQLTLLEADLFVRVVPYECLGSLWSRRGRRGQEGACPSVRATVRQFNRVAGAVVRSCLGPANLRPLQRARLLEKWIRVAEECRNLRNFSSLYAIISALQSSPVHRLKRTWDEISREAQRSYEELSTICSEQDNYSLSRQLLFQEGTSKPPGADPIPRRQQRRPQEQRPMGVVPYLGTFLRDLVMLDAAVKDELENGYINFEKRRKEFEVLAQLRLLQSICRNYSLQPDPAFQHWLHTLQPLPEAQSHTLSCEIEPPGEAPTPQRPLKPTLVITHCTELLSSVGNPLISWDRPSSTTGPATSPDLLLSPHSSQLLSRLAQHMKWPSVSTLDVAPEDAATSAASPSPTPGGFARTHRRSASCGSAFPSPQSGIPASDCRIIRARMGLSNGSLYKSVLVTSQEKAPAVIAKVLEKHSQDPATASQYQLVQLLPEDRELILPPTANVFYAMNSTSLDFLLRPKGPPALHSPAPSTPSRRPELSATFPKIKATGRKFTRALF
ncbi:ral guanine nucleotide dissociation stimulator-like 2 isoform X1 [Alligator mississippiensis]|uniref:ral guanine nucleotide dissociation stimulator-like 2 isoform X1 n=1 Tax=Alligator mississippiensis TaxID=8496 RepID=UPI0009071E2F|nr:ral guanine nucleotide dissociation stimulator-like 2 isoform X1 [Alligator mississippiensis]